VPLEGLEIDWYQQLVGKFMYLMYCTRPDTAFTETRLAKYTATPTAEHAKAAKRMLQYYKGLHSTGIVLGGKNQGSIQLTGYTDSDFAGDLDDRKSTGGYIFLLNGGPIQWRSKQQTIVAGSTMESEYIACSDAVREGIWINNLLKDVIPEYYTGPPTIYTDNAPAEALAKSDKNTQRSKHIDVRYHIVRDNVANKRVKLSHVATGDNIADIMTKALPTTTHRKHMSTIKLQ
jgi:hypothetical protein